MNLHMRLLRRFLKVVNSTSFKILLVVVPIALLPHFIGVPTGAGWLGLITGVASVC
jgi:hypothetical protein